MGQLHGQNADGWAAGDANPFRYRGYYYDAESDFYYLQSRYYDPVSKRFMSADSWIDMSRIFAFNLFLYCFNNPVNRYDLQGRDSESVGMVDDDSDLLQPELEELGAAKGFFSGGGNDGGGEKYPLSAIKDFFKKAFPSRSSSQIKVSGANADAWMIGFGMHLAVRNANKYGEKPVRQIFA